MFGLNATGWLALHRQQHSQLIAEAAVTLARAPRTAPLTSRAPHPSRSPLAAACAPAPACATC